MKQHVQIELDVVFNDDVETPEQAAVNLAESVYESGITIELVNDHGPGGGWPVYRFTGSLGSIVEMVHGYCNETLSETVEYLRGLRVINTPMPTPA
jgi:hypothetical protein